MIGSRRARSFAVVLATVGTLTCARARADAAPAPKTEALAQVLFEEGIVLMREGRFDEACPKLAESQRLDPGGGTVLNLGSCLEQLGQLASAYAAYGEALSAAIRDKRRERESTARDRLAALLPKMSRLELHVGDASLPELRLDGLVLGATAWKTPIPIDPGSHVLEASGPGLVPWKRVIQVPDNGLHVGVDVPRLEVAAAPRKPTPADPDATPAAPSTRRVVGTVGLVTGAVLLGVGAAAGGFALAKKSESDRQCPTASSCSEAGIDSMRAADTLAWTSNIAIGVGLLAAAAGGVLFFTAPKATKVRVGLGLVSGVF